MRSVPRISDNGGLVKRNFLVLVFCSLALAGYSAAQTFEIGGQPSQQKQSTPQKGKKGKKQSSGPSPLQMAWGGEAALKLAVTRVRRSKPWGKVIMPPP